jgi:hypothetical protein
VRLEPSFIVMSATLQSNFTSFTPSIASTVSRTALLSLQPTPLMPTEYCFAAGAGISSARASPASPQAANAAARAARPNAFILSILLMGKPVA